MNRDCENCLKRKTMLCPNSDKCYALDNKPYYVDKDDAIKELQRLNNIIEELEKDLEFEINDYNGDIDLETRNIDSEFLRGNAWEADYLLKKLKELKGGKK